MDDHGAFAAGLLGRSCGLVLTAASGTQRARPALLCCISGRSVTSPRDANNTHHTGEPAKIGPLPDPQTLLLGTDWASLWHAYGPAEDTPSTLAKLMDDEPAVRADALEHLFNTVYHQNSIYPATVPTTLYLAAILSEPRAATTLIDERIRSRIVPPRPLRVLLLDRLGGIAYDVDDAVVAQLERFGFSLDGYPAMAELRAQRPVILQAVSAFLHDPDPATGMRPPLRPRCSSTLPT
ncbi:MULTISPECIES: hypothetical protein [unclassified Micromonospora]|uniref:hypothetical protein n=1 Tax=unclassified Micromonospora TaxID=2617518 RepID=UPI002FF3161D